MTAYVACKKCRFGGKDYMPGDTIPEDTVAPKKAGELRAMGFITPSRTTEGKQTPAANEAETKPTGRKTKAADKK